MTVTKNIRIGLMPDEIRRVLGMNIESDEERRIGRSVGFNERQLESHPYELSLGDLRRLELARTIATNPKLLLLDEVFAGLTTAEIAGLSQLLKEKKEEGLTFIIVSHDLKSLAPLVDRVVVVSFGQMIANGSFEEVIANKKVKEAYLGI
jgi:ABC-type branched-subunit amino acid transport system ATPase component